MALIPPSGLTASTPLPPATQAIMDRAFEPGATEDDFYALIKALRQEGMIAQARDALDTLGRKFRVRDDIRFQLESASLSVAEGHDEQACTLLDELKARHPKNCHAFLAKADILARKGEYGAALDTIRAISLGDLPKAMHEKVVFRGIQLGIYMAARGGRPEFIAPRMAPPFENAVATMMIRDEEDIIGQNMRHHYRLGFRKFTLVLNCCRDATAEIIEEFRREHADSVVVTITDPVEGYYQADKTQAAIELARDYFAAVSRPVDWCFVLDADEFLCIDNDLSLGDLIGMADRLGKRFIALHLCNATAAEVAEFDPGANAYVHFNIVAGCSVPVVTKNAFRTGINARISMGNHSLYYPALCIEDAFIAAEVGARLIHLPYRSCQQIRSKIVNGGSAYQATNLDVGLGAHWRLLYRDFLENGDEVLVRQLAAYHQRTAGDASNQTPFRFR